MTCSSVGQKVSTHGTDLRAKQGASKEMLVGNDSRICCWRMLRQDCNCTQFYNSSSAAGVS